MQLVVATSQLCLLSYDGVCLLCPHQPSLTFFIYVLSLQDNTNIDAAITCLVKNIMSVEEERAK